MKDNEEMYITIFERKFQNNVNAIVYKEPGEKTILEVYQIGEKNIAPIEREYSSIRIAKQAAMKYAKDIGLKPISDWREQK